MQGLWAQPEQVLPTQNAGGAQSRAGCAESGAGARSGLTTPLGPLEATGVVASRLSSHPIKGLTNQLLNLDCIQAANNQQKQATKIPLKCSHKQWLSPASIECVSSHEPAIQAQRLGGAEPLNLAETPGRLNSRSSAGPWAEAHR